MTRDAMAFLRQRHAEACYEQGDHVDEVDTAYSLGADALDRAEKAEAALAAQQPETLAWAVAMEDGDILAGGFPSRKAAEKFASQGEGVIRVAIRVVEDET